MQLFITIAQDGGRASFVRELCYRPTRATRAKPWDLTTITPITRVAMTIIRIIIVGAIFARTFIRIPFSLLIPMPMKAWGRSIVTLLSTIMVDNMQIPGSDTPFCQVIHTWKRVSSAEVVVTSNSETRQGHAF
jgi:hypothetical protein